MSQLSVSVLLFGAFSNMVLACLLEPLRVVRDETGAAIAWRILTETDRPLESSSGLSIAPDGPLAAAPPADLVLLVGGDHFRRPSPDRGFGRRLGAAIRGATVIAADTGAWVLARHGHLDGRRATLHWQLLGEFAETFPTVETVAEPVVRDGRFSITAIRGALSQ